MSYRGDTVCPLECYGMLIALCLIQVAVDQAAFLLDLAAVDCTWDDVREQLANFYKEGGFEEISRFVSTI